MVLPFQFKKNKIQVAESLLNVEAYLRLYPESDLKPVVWTVEQGESGWKKEGQYLPERFPVDKVEEDVPFKITLAGYHFGNCFYGLEDWDDEGDFLEPSCEWNHHHRLVKSLLSEHNKYLPDGLVQDPKTGLILHEDVMTFTYQRLWKEWVDFLEESGALSELSLNDRDVDSRYGRLKTLRNLFVEQQRFLKQLVMAIDFSTHLLGTLEEFQTKIVTGITTSLKRPKPTCFEDYLVLENSIIRLLDLSRSLINEAVLDKGQSYGLITSPRTPWEKTQPQVNLVWQKESSSSARYYSVQRPFASNIFFKPPREFKNNFLTKGVLSEENSVWQNGD